jgi:hypothetical protein
MTDTLPGYTTPQIARVIHRHTELYKTDNPDESAAIQNFHSQETFQGSLKAYFALANIIAGERSRDWQKASPMNFIVNIPGEHEQIICAVNGHVDKVKLRKALESGRVTYPIPKKHGHEPLAVSLEQFQSWLEVADTVNQWCLKFYAVEGSIGNLVQKDLDLQDEDFKFIRLFLEQFNRSLRQIYQMDCSALGDQNKCRIRVSCWQISKLLEQTAELIKQKNTLELLPVLDEIAHELANIHVRITCPLFGREITNSH